MVELVRGRAVEHASFRSSGGNVDRAFFVFRYHMSDLDKIGGVPVVMREPPSPIRRSSAVVFAKLGSMES